MNGLYPQSVGLDVIRRHTFGLAEIGDSVDPSLPVTTCGEWTLADLVWHLTEVQAFWAHIIGGRPDAGPETYDVPTRPETAALPDALREASERLLASLTGADPAESAWSWSHDHTVGFTIRRQSQEALVHHIDGVVAAGTPMPDVAPELAADGVDELISIMLTGMPEWAELIPGDRAVQLRTTDTGDAWTMGFGRMVGTAPDGETVNETTGELLADHAAVGATVSGGALDMLLWLWGRGPSDPLVVDGDTGLVADVRALVVEASQ